MSLKSWSGEELTIQHTGTAFHLIRDLYSFLILL